MAPLLAALAKFGLPILANAIAAKGKDVIEEKLGVDIGKLIGSEEGRIQLKQLEMQHEEFLVNAALREKEMNLAADAAGQAQVTERWRHDMASDSKLSKNIRPAAFAYMLFCATLMPVLEAAFPDFKIRDAWVHLIENLLMLIAGAYFVGRSGEKITSIVKGKR